MTIQATATIRPTAPTCQARVGYRAGDYGEVPIWCRRSVAIGSFIDKQGVRRYACQADGHRASVVRQYGEAFDDGTAVFDAPDPIEQAKAEKDKAAETEEWVAHLTIDGHDFEVEVVD